MLHGTVGWARRAPPPLFSSCRFIVASYKYDGRTNSRWATILMDPTWRSVWPAVMGYVMNRTQGIVLFQSLFWTPHVGARPRYVQSQDATPSPSTGALLKKSKRPFIDRDRLRQGPIKSGAKNRGGSVAVGLKQVDFLGKVQITNNPQAVRYATSKDDLGCSASATHQKDSTPMLDHIKKLL